jgi:hypothetical protein
LFAAIFSCIKSITECHLPMCICVKFITVPLGMTLACVLIPVAEIKLIAKAGVLRTGLVAHVKDTQKYLPKNVRLVRVA